jgi:hypothetical protein
MPETKQEILMIVLTIPVNSDEQLLDVKNKIKQIADDNPNAKMEFRITSVPVSIVK